MVSVSDLSASASKLERRGRNAQQDFEQGVENTTDSDQQQATLDAATNWEQGVQEAISEGRFEDGVNDPKRSWQEASLETGASRFVDGVGNAGDIWESNFQEYADTLESLNLEPRGPRGSAANFDRSRAVGEALNNQRTQG